MLCKKYNDVFDSLFEGKWIKNISIHFWGAGVNGRIKILFPKIKNEFVSFWIQEMALGDHMTLSLWHTNQSIESWARNTNLTGNSTILSILSLQMKFLKENLLSWMMRVWGSRQMDICLVASRCSLQEGQYLQVEAEGPYV